MAPRRKFGSIRARVLALGMTLVGLWACSLPNTRVARGQLASLGMSPYDDYFKKVHAEQVSSTTWPDDRREARKPLVTTLGLLPDASSDVIVAAARERVRTQGLASVVSIVDGVASRELARAERLDGVAKHLEELANEGDDLSPRTVKDFPADSSKRRDAQNELGAAVDALRQLAISARSQTRETRRFVAELGEATGTHHAAPSASAPPPSPPAAPSASSASPAPPAAPTPPKKPPAKPVAKPAEPKPAETKPPPKPPGEEFTP